jgi:hypothetical protein
MIKLSDREMAIAKIAWSSGYEFGHDHTVEGHYAPPEDYDFDILMAQLADGIFDSIPPNAKVTGPGEKP